MSRLLFLILASIVILGGLVAVVWATRRIPRVAPVRTRLFASILLIGYVVVIILRPLSWLVIDLAVLMGAIGGAVLIGANLRTARSVVAFLVTAAVVDILSISSGFSRLIIDQYQAGTSDLLLYLTLVMPIGTRLVPIVGVSDLLVGGSAATALIRIGLRPIAVIGALTVGFIAALAYGLWRGGAPGLPFIAVTIFLVVWWSSIDPARQVNGPSGF